MEFFNELVTVSGVSGGVAVLVWIVVAYFVVRWGGRYIEIYEERNEEEFVSSLTYRLVMAAEEYFVSGEQKYNWVVNNLKRQVEGLTDEDARTWIDATVRYIKSIGAESSKEESLGIHPAAREGVRPASSVMNIESSGTRNLIVRGDLIVRGGFVIEEEEKEENTPPYPVSKGA